MKKRRCLAVLLSAAMIAAMTGCGKQSEGTEAKSEAQGSSGASETSKQEETSGGSFSGKLYIGSIDPMTGGAASYGQEKIQGETLAVEEINAAGGILGMEVVLISEDSASQAAQAATVATKLITQNEVVAIQGAQTSSETMAILDILAEYGVPAVCPATSPKIGASGNAFINRCSPDDGLQVEALIKYAGESLKLDKIGVLYSNDDYGKGGYDSAVACADKYGVELVSDSFMGDDQNFSAQLTKIKDAGCEAILMWCQPTPASLIMKQASDMGWSPQYLCGPGVNDPRLFELSNGLCDKAILSTSFYADNPDEYVSAWVERYRQRWNMEPSLTASLGYDGMMIIFKGIEAAGSAEPKAIAEGIRTLKDFQTLKGMASVDAATGNLQSPVYLVTANNESRTYDYFDTVKID